MSAAAPAAALLVVAIFVGYAVWGENGLLALPGYRHQIAQREVELAALDAEHARLANHKRLLQQGDPDYADERTRDATGMILPDEYVMKSGR